VENSNTLNALIHLIKGFKRMKKYLFGEINPLNESQPNNFDIFVEVRTPIFDLTISIFLSIKLDL